MINDGSVINIELDINAINENTKNVLIIGSNISGLFGHFYKDIKTGEVKENTNKSKEYKYRTRYFNNLLFFKKCIDNNVNIYFISSDKDAYENYNYMMGFLIENPKRYALNEMKKKSKLFHFIKNIKHNDDMLLYVNKIANRNMKFDYIIQNPPYTSTSDKNFHICFLETGYKLLSDTGKMVIIEPATMYFDIRDNGNNLLPAVSRFKPAKELIKDNVYKVVIDNYNKAFNINSFQQFAITYIDKSQISNGIEFIIYGEKRIVKNIYDCIYVGDRMSIDSIINKCKQFKDCAINHVYDKSINISDKIYFMRYAYLRTMNGAQSEIDYQETPFGSFYNYNTLIVHKEKIINKTPSTYCYFGTKPELENYMYYAYNNKLPVFLAIILTYGRHNNVLPYIPWICDKQYTDDEIYKKLKLSKNEIDIIETTIKYYEKTSPIFKRYMGVEISDEEVQEFINK